MSKQDLVHRATEPASAPIGQGSAGDASASSPIRREVRSYIKKLEHDNEAAAARITQIEFNSQSAAARIATLEAALEDCLEYFTDKYDVVDGSYGEPAPNKEMQFGQMITEALYGPGVV